MNKFDIRAAQLYILMWMLARTRDKNYIEMNSSVQNHDPLIYMEPRSIRNDYFSKVV